jgi:nickel-dependent lactate racemase
MQIGFAFGTSGLSLELPDGFSYQILEARSGIPLPDPAEALEQALDNPIGTPALTQLARGKRSAAISICDITRPAPNQQTLPPLLRRLEQAGIPREAITILIATGLHRPATEEEILRIAGKEVVSRYRVLNHHAREISEHRHLGSTQRGTPVYIDSRFLDADLRLSVGFIEPHLMLGFSGGRKLVAPGLAGEQTIKTIHSPKFMREPKSTEGSIDDNPLHHELLEIARMAGHSFILDVALSRDRRIAGVFAGHPEQAHAAGVKFVAKTLLEQIQQPADVAITSAAGYPLDLTFYQAIKGITAAAHIVKPGGRILLIAECREGAGADEFSRMLKDLPPFPEFLETLARAPVTIDQWQLEKLALVAQKAEVHYFVPGLPQEFRTALQGKAHENANAALEAVLGDLPLSSSVAVIPEGPYVLARAAAAA